MVNLANAGIPASRTVASHTTRPVYWLVVLKWLSNSGRWKSSDHSVPTVYDIPKLYFSSLQIIISLTYPPFGCFLMDVT